MKALTAVVPLQRPAATSAHAPGWALVEQAQAGDMDAYAQLWAEHHPMVLRYVQVRVRSTAAAEDLAGDVFARALRSLADVEYQGTAIGAWFVTIARNRVADYYKSGRYRLEVVGLSGLDFEGLDRADDAPGPEQIAAAGGTASQVRLALACLTVDQREVIVRRFYNGLSVDDTAKAMGRQTGAIKALQYRAIQALRNALGADLAELR